MERASNGKMLIFIERMQRSDNHHLPHIVKERNAEKADCGEEIEIEAAKASEKALHTVPGVAGQSNRLSGGAWDEFPNGRFGDARSPAYGEIDGWGISLKIVVSQYIIFFI